MNREVALAGGEYRRVLVLGGARSGKSAFAERLAREWGRPVLYVATAEALDGEMAERIALHRARRPAEWRTLEAPLDVAAAVAREAAPGSTVLLEDLTLWLSNEGFRDAGSVGTSEAGFDGGAEQRVIGKIGRLMGLRCNMVLVSNEVGMGLVPPYPLGRAFRDALGRVNQAAARLATEAYLLVAGLPLQLKPARGPNESGGEPGTSGDVRAIT